MLLRRISSLLLLFAVSTGLASYAVETTTAKTKKHHSTNSDGTLKRAPIAKPFKTTKRRTSKSSSRSAKTSSTKSSLTANTTTTAATKTAVSLHPKSPAVTLSREALTERIEQSLASPRLGIENPRALHPF